MTSYMSMQRLYKGSVDDAVTPDSAELNGIAKTVLSLGAVAVLATSVWGCAGPKAAVKGTAGEPEAISATPDTTEVFQPKLDRRGVSALGHRYEGAEVQVRKENFPESAKKMGYESEEVAVAALQLFEELRDQGLYGGQDPTSYDAELEKFLAELDGADGRTDGLARQKGIEGIRTKHEGGK